MQLSLNWDSWDLCFAQPKCMSYTLCTRKMKLFGRDKGDLSDQKRWQILQLIHINVTEGAISPATESSTIYPFGHISYAPTITFKITRKTTNPYGF